MSTEILASAEAEMNRALSAMERDFARLQAGRASLSVVEQLSVDHVGGRASLGRLASISIPDPRQIVIVPWDPSALRAIGAAIAQSDIGLTPTIDGPAIRLFVPPLTEERRWELVRLVHRRMERARIEIRDHRHAALGALREEERGAAIGADAVRRDIERLTRLTDRSSAEVDRLGRIKEDSLLAI